MSAFSDFSNFYNNSSISDEKYGMDPHYNNNFPLQDKQEDMTTNIDEIDIPQNVNKRNEDFNKVFQLNKIIKQIVNDTKDCDETTAIYKYLLILNYNNIISEYIQNNNNPELESIINLHNNATQLLQNKISNNDNSNINWDIILSPDVMIIFTFVIIYMMILYRII